MQPSMHEMCRPSIHAAARAFKPGAARARRCAARRCTCCRCWRAGAWCGCSAWDGTAGTTTPWCSPCRQRQSGGGSRRRRAPGPRTRRQAGGRGAARTVAARLIWHDARGGSGAASFCKGFQSHAARSPCVGRIINDLPSDLTRSCSLRARLLERLPARPASGAGRSVALGSGGRLAATRRRSPHSKQRRARAAQEAAGRAGVVERLEAGEPAPAPSRQHWPDDAAAAARHRRACRGGLLGRADALCLDKRHRARRRPGWERQPCQHACPTASATLCAVICSGRVAALPASAIRASQ